MNLFEIGVEGEQLQDLMAENEGELTPELEERVNEFLAGGKEKINSALLVRRRLEFEARACREEAERLWARAKSIEANRERLSNLILFAVDAGFGGKVKTAFFTAYAQTSGKVQEFRMSPDADIAQFADANPDLVRVTRELNKTVIKELVKDGGLLPQEIVVDERPGKRFLMVK
jgi:hypothetical protein